MSEASDFVPYSREFRGAEGMAAISRSGTRFSAADPGRFRARLDVVPLAKTRIVSMKATPHRGVWGDQVKTSRGGDAIFFHVILAGASVGNQDGRTMLHREGSVKILRTSSPFHNVTSAPVHVVNLWIDPVLLRSEVVEVLPAVTGVELSGDPLAVGAVAIIRSVLETAMDGGRHTITPGSSEAVALERILLDQLQGLILSVDVARRGGAKAREVFARVHAILEADIASDSHTIESLAAALDLAPTLVERTVRAHGTTVAKMIREARLEALADALRVPVPEEGGSASLAEVAASVGFAGLSQAARSFKTRYGMTMGDYRTLARL